MQNTMQTVERVLATFKERPKNAGTGFILTTFPKEQTREKVQAKFPQLRAWCLSSGDLLTRRVRGKYKGSEHAVNFEAFAQEFHGMAQDKLAEMLVSDGMKEKEAHATSKGLTAPLQEG